MAYIDLDTVPDERDDGDVIKTVERMVAGRATTYKILTEQGAAGWPVVRFESDDVDDLMLVVAWYVVVDRQEAMEEIADLVRRIRVDEPPA